MGPVESNSLWGRKGMQNLGLCMAFKQGGILIVPNLLLQRIALFSRLYDKLWGTEGIF